MKKEKGARIKYKYGYDLRILFAVLMLMPTIVCIIMGIIFFSIGLRIGNTGEQYEGIGIFAGGVFSFVVSFLGFFGAVKGRTYKWGNKLCIVLGGMTSFIVFGIFGILGGVCGNKVLDYPELDKASQSGCGLRWIFAVLLICASIGLLCCGVLCAVSVEAFAGIVFCLLGAFTSVSAVLCTIGAVKGNVSVKANIFSIIVGAIFCIAFIGIFGVVGGVKGRKYAAEYGEEEKEFIARKKEIKDELEKTKINCVIVNVL